MTHRIPRSVTIAGLAVVGSLGAHMAALAWQALPDPVEIEGGGGATMAMEGTSFADMAQGRLEAVSPDGAEAVRPVETTLPVATQTAAAPPPEASAPPGPVTAEAASPVAPAVTAPSPVPVTVPVTAAPTERSQVAETEEAVEAVEETTTPRLSARPRARPAAAEERAAAVRAEDARDGQAERAPAEPARRGNEAPTDATRGTAGGSEAGRAARSGQGRAQAAGNAAASNYPGQVQARILRQRMPRGSGRGTARVSFTVAANGGLAALGISASSGSGQLDQAALRIVQHAAPFPPPPAGAQRNFTVPVQGR